MGMQPRIISSSFGSLHEFIIWRHRLQCAKFAMWNGSSYGDSRQKSLLKSKLICRSFPTYASYVTKTKSSSLLFVMVLDNVLVTYSQQARDNYCCCCSLTCTKECLCTICLQTKSKTSPGLVIIGQLTYLSTTNALPSTVPKPLTVSFSLWLSTFFLSSNPYVL